MVQASPSRHQTRTARLQGSSAANAASAPEHIRGDIND
jgi:hypothetical protein